MPEEPKRTPAQIDDAFDRYMAGDPLNEENAAIRAGNADKIAPLPTAEKKAPRPVTDPERELTMTERARLRELRAHEGWPVLLRLAEKIYRQRLSSVITMSQVEPIENAVPIGVQWSKLGQYKMAVHELTTAVTAEVERAREEGAKDDGMDGDQTER